FTIGCVQTLATSPCRRPFMKPEIGHRTPGIGEFGSDTFRFPVSGLRFSSCLRGSSCLHRMTRWKSFRYRLEEIACRSLGWIIPKFSRGGLVRFAHALGILAFRFDRRGRTVALSNLECVFGSRFTETERAEIARRSYQNFALTMLGLFWATRLNAENFRKWIIPEGFEALREQLTASKRGAVFMCIHQGNWEWASLVCGFLGFGNVVVAENFKNPRLTDVFKDLRERSGQTLIGQENSLLRLLKV